MSNPSWELCKENVAPLSRGRDKSSLNTALHASRDEVASMHAAHEAAVDAALAGNGPHASDPLAPAAAFVKWAAEAYPPKANQLLRALERSCRSFVGDSRYTNDPRFVRLWVRYADVRTDPLDCFTFMRTNGIGDVSALFYEAWATTLEYKRDFRAADSAYKLGLDRNAQPKARLEQRQREFLSRMVARDRRAEARKAKAARSEGNSQMLPSSTRTRTEARASPTDENVRPALGALTSKQAASGRRPLAATQVAAPGNGLSSSRPRQGQSSANSNTGATFKVFADPKHERSGLQEDPAASLPTLAKLDDVRKEDEGELPSQWAGAVLPQSSPLARARERTRQRQNAPTSFAMYSDPQEEAKAGLSERESVQAMEVDSSTRRGRWTTAGPEQQPSTASGPPSPTINTKIANKLVEDMFNSPLPCERENPCVENDALVEASSGLPVAAASRPKPTFEIFQDAPEKEEGVGGNTPAGMNFRGEKESDNRARDSGKDHTTDCFLEKPSVLETQPERNSSQDCSQVSVEQKTGTVTPQEEESANSDRTPPEQGMKNTDEWYAETCVDMCPDFPCYRMMLNSCSELSSGAVISLQGDNEKAQSFFVESKLGDGYLGDSVVFSASPLDEIAGHEDDEDDMIVSIKSSESVKLLWEFYIYNVLGQRVQDAQALLLFPKALFFYHGEPKAYLVTDRVSTASLGQVLDLPSLEFGISEMVSLFFFVETLRALEVIHATGIIHADLTLDNIVIRKNGHGRWSGRFDPLGKNGWGDNGVSLIDFNNAVDTRHAAVHARTGQDIIAHTRFIGDSHMSREYMSGAPGSPWGFSADCHSVCVCARKLLNSQRRTAHEDVWDRTFQQLERVSPTSLSHESSAVVQDCRHKLEDVLIRLSSKDDGASLRAELKSIFIAASEARQAQDVTRG